MKRKAADVELESGKKVEQDWRMVRVSRQAGVKDRHSKVLTAQGLRDRRVRLSLPTAFQLYDLQHKLGYEQPSKAVDWLIKAAKSAIDELPVLVPEMASASAGNVAHLTTSISSIVEHFVGSSRALTVPLDPQSNNDDNLSGIHTHISPELDNVQQLWDYNITPSCTDMLCTHDSRPLQNMHSLAAAFQKSFQPVPSISASRHDVIESPCLQSYEMVDSGKKCRHMGVSLEEARAYIPDMIMENGEQQQQQQAYLLLNHYTSTLVPTFSNNVNLLTPSLSSSGPVPAFSSSITNVPSLSQTHQNAEGDVSADAAHDFLPFQQCEDCQFQEFH